MILRKQEVESARRPEGDGFTGIPLSDMAGLTQYGAYLQTLAPGARSSDLHWHEEEDEFVLALTDNVTIIEDGHETLLASGDAAAWPAGSPIAHSVINRSDEPCTYLVMGTRVVNDICHYPELGRTLYTVGKDWRIEDESGAVLKSGIIGEDD